ncbi:MAG: MBL fold metallo-hydrolase [Eubacteriales bacterium]|nr:MBL fold metallo-hydrolase [Eubacteriales bacterium]
MPALADFLTIYPESWKHSNTYYLDLAGGVLIDPGLDKPGDFNQPVAKVIATHGHYDHLRALESWLGEGVDFYFPAGDLSLLDDMDANASKLFADKRIFPQPDHALEDQEKISLGQGYSLTCYHTPGHTPGSSCFLLTDEGQGGKSEKLCLFTGDTIFSNSVGRTDLLAGDPGAMQESLQRLQKLLQTWPGDMPVLAGHGPASSVSDLLRKNPYLR